MSEEPVSHKIILTPITGGHTDDSARTIADCGHPCWIAPTSLAAVNNPLLHTETVCSRCVDPAALSAALVAQGGPLALRGVRGELNRKLGVAQTDQLFAEYRIREHDPEED